MQEFVPVENWTKLFFIAYGVALTLFAAALSVTILRPSEQLFTVYLLFGTAMAILLSVEAIMIVGISFFNSKVPEFLAFGSMFVLYATVIGFVIPLICIVEYERLN